MPIIDHVGIAVKSLEASIPAYEALLGRPAAGIETVADEGVRVALFGHGAGRIELLEPIGDDSPVGRFLARHGPGVHHVCVRVPDLDAALERSSRDGVEAIPPGVRTGAEGRRVAFLHPRDTGGILLELCEAIEP